MRQLEPLEPRSLVGAAELRLGALRQPGRSTRHGDRWPSTPADGRSRARTRGRPRAARSPTGGAGRRSPRPGRRAHRRRAPRRRRRAAASSVNLFRKSDTRPKQMLRRRIEQAEAPVDRGAHRSMALGRIPGACSERVEAGVEKPEQLRRRPRPEPRGSKLDRERDPVEPVADLGEERRAVRRPRRPRRSTLLASSSRAAAASSGRTSTTRSAESRGRSCS